MDNMQTELIRHRHTLAVVGIGAIAFGIWSLIKSILYFVLVNPISDVVAALNETTPDFEYEPVFTLVLTLSIIGVFVLADLLLRWKVGRKAIAISRCDKNPGAGFFILSFILMLMDLTELVVGVLSIAGIMSSEEDITDQISTLLVDFTSVVMLIEMIIAAVMIRKLTKAIAEGQNTARRSSDAA